MGGTLVGVVLPTLAPMLSQAGIEIELAKAPLLWELGNNATRPLVYFMTNPAVWDGLRNLCCRKKHQLVNDDEVDELEQPLAPVTTVLKKPKPNYKKRRKEDRRPKFRGQKSRKRTKNHYHSSDEKKDKKSVNIFWHWIQQPYYLSITNK